jgi:hypothetical protein
MASRFEGQDILEAAVASIPALADYIAAVPEKQRMVALGGSGATLLGNRPKFGVYR